MKKHHRLGWVTMLVAVGAFLVALPAQATAAPTTGYLRIGHFVPGVGVAQVDLDGRVLVGALSYQQVTSYVAVPAGSHTLEVTTSASGGTAAHQLSATETVGAGQSVTVLIVASPSGAMRASSFVDNLSEPPPGDAKVRVIDTLATVPGLGGNLTMVMDPPSFASDARAGDGRRPGFSLRGCSGRGVQRGLHEFEHGHDGPQRKGLAGECRDGGVVGGPAGNRRPDSGGAQGRCRCGEPAGRRHADGRRWHGPSERTGAVLAAWKSDSVW